MGRFLSICQASVGCVSASEYERCTAGPYEDFFNAAKKKRGMWVNITVSAELEPKVFITFEGGVTNIQDFVKGIRRKIKP